MTLIDKRLLCALCVLGAAIPLVASADDDNKSTQSGFEFGAGAGGGLLDLPVPGTTGSTSVGGGAYTAFVGYRVNRWAAVEAAYLNSGSVEQLTVEQNTAGQNIIKEFIKTDPHLVTATAMGILPITQDFSLYGRAGLAHIWYNASFGISYVGEGSFSGTSNELIWGGGMSLSVDRALLRLEYQQTKANLDDAGDTFDAKLRVLTLSVAWML